ncbi:MAG: tRNA lysidine(34) synthetase TilS, partial [Minisyncoccia bacterium]
IEEKRNIEKKLREKRYEKLYEIAEKTKCNKIATGHTLDDHIETFLINLFRGSGISGLCGIWPESNIFPDSKIVIIRPLLCIEKKEIVEYLEKNKINYFIDASNLSTVFFRNRIRNEVIPFLLKYKPSIKNVIFKTTNILQEEENFLRKYTEDILKKISRKEKNRIIIDTEKFKKLALSIKRRIASIIYREITQKPYINFSKIEKIIKEIEKGESIYDREIIDRILKGEKEKKKSFFYLLKVPGKTEILNRFIVESNFVSYSERIFKNPDKFTGYFDFSKIKEDIIVRNRKSGDKFMPLGFKNEKKLSRFMIDKKIPKRERDEILIFENDGKIIWVCGYEISETVKVNEKTEKILKIKVRNKNEKKDFC